MRYLSKKRGLSPWQVLRDGDTWVDLVTWETMQDAMEAANDDGDASPTTQKYYSFIAILAALETRCIRWKKATRV